MKGLPRACRRQGPRTAGTVREAARPSWRALRAARTSTVHALADAARPPRRTPRLIAISARLPASSAAPVRRRSPRPRSARSPQWHSGSRWPRASFPPSVTAAAIIAASVYRYSVARPSSRGAWATSATLRFTSPCFTASASAPRRMRWTSSTVLGASGPDYTRSALAQVARHVLTVGARPPRHRPRSPGYTAPPSLPNTYLSAADSLPERPWAEAGLTRDFRTSSR